jgi:mono/diheme cytochrome c family protein
MAFLAVAIVILGLGAATACGRGEAKQAGGDAGTVVQQESAPPAIEGRVSAGGSPPPTRPLENPFAGQAAAVEEGGKLFQAFNCDGCHGVGAVGAWAPNLADGRWRYGGSPGVIFGTIYGGRANGMPAFGGALPESSIWKIVTYLQSLQPTEDQPTVSF